MSIFEKLGLSSKSKEHTSEKMNHLKMFANISSLFAEQIWLEQNDAEIQRLTIEIFETLNKYSREIDKNNQFQFGNFIIHIDPKGKMHTIENPSTRERVSVDLSNKNHLVIVEKSRF